MEFAGGLGATLISVDNRYLYQIGGSSPQCQNIVRLDLEHINKGWKVYEILDKFMKVPRHFLDLEARKTFDREHPDYEEGQFYEDQADNQEDAGREWWERSSVNKALNKSYMGVIHFP